MKLFSELELDDMISYASYVACKGNDLIEWLHKAKKAFTDEERLFLKDKANKAFLEYVGATIEVWEAEVKAEERKESENVSE